MTFAPPTIAHLQSEGVQGVLVMCANLKCRHLGTVPFEVIGALSLSAVLAVEVSAPANVAVFPSNPIHDDC
jgi:hypothetical protein